MVPQERDGVHAVMSGQEPAYNPVGIIRYYGFDIRLLLERHIRELAARRRARDPGGS